MTQAVTLLDCIAARLSGTLPQSTPYINVISIGWLHFGVELQHPENTEPVLIFGPVLGMGRAVDHAMLARKTYTAMTAQFDALRKRATDAEQVAINANQSARDANTARLTAQETVLSQQRTITRMHSDILRLRTTVEKLNSKNLSVVPLQSAPNQHPKQRHGAAR